MAETHPPYRMAAALALTTALVYWTVPILIANPAIATFADRFILHPAQPVVTGLAFGAAVGILLAITYFFYSTIKQIV